MVSEDPLVSCQRLLTASFHNNVYTMQLCLFTWAPLSSHRAGCQSTGRVRKSIKYAQGELQSAPVNVAGGGVCRTHGQVYSLHQRVTVSDLAVAISL